MSAEDASNARQVAVRRGRLAKIAMEGLPI
jgi:hypothetical protein